uniref:F-box domain-containing protein n=1 Tax=Palpitomonas bilix TaxID=652834 RepID=A0A7S3DDN6_9EUKA|mmetsp:Transcript_3247/g.6322  ORF Transcript_3247/g.6322 Transcript_3247/m.6322 type:complete len:372 (+) Transcript_3247:127-1242(+)
MLDLLPPDICEHVCEYLSGNEIARLRLSSRPFRFLPSRIQLLALYYKKLGWVDTMPEIGPALQRRNVATNSHWDKLRSIVTTSEKFTSSKIIDAVEYLGEQFILCHRNGGALELRAFNSGRSCSLPVRAFEVWRTKEVKLLSPFEMSRSVLLYTPECILFIDLPSLTTRPLFHSKASQYSPTFVSLLYEDGGIAYCTSEGVGVGVLHSDKGVCDERLLVTSDTLSKTISSLFPTMPPSKDYVNGMEPIALRNHGCFCCWYRSVLFCFLIRSVSSPGKAALRPSYIIPSSSRISTVKALYEPGTHRSSLVVGSVDMNISIVQISPNSTGTGLDLEWKRRVSIGIWPTSIVPLMDSASFLVSGTLEDFEQVRE